MLLLAGCNADDDDAAGRSTTTPLAMTPTTRATSTTTTEPADPFAIPDTFTTEYVQRILEEHERIFREGTQIAIDNGAVTPEVESRYRAVLGQELAQAELDNLVEIAATGFAGLRPDQGSQGIRVVQLYSTTEQCIGALVEYSFELVQTDPQPPVEQNVELRPVEAGQDPEGFNRTPWVTEFNLNPGGEGNPAPCTG